MIGKSLVIILLHGCLHAATNADFNSNLPIIVIDTHGQKILNEPRIVAHMGIVDNGVGALNSPFENYNGYDGPISIEYRGDSSQQFPKKQFAIETQDSLGHNVNVSLLGMPPENDWILYAPYSDKSLMRNVLAYKLSRDLGHYASRTRYCELVLNGEYAGIYVLMEKIKRDRNRVAVAEMDSTDVEGLGLSGGYIVKVDKRAGENVDGWQSPFPLYYPNANGPRPFYQYHYPKPDEILPQQAEYIRDFIYQFESMMSKPEYDDPAGGMWTALDMSSVIDFVIVNEVSRNVDGYRLSTFLYKDRDDRNSRLRVGPVWDFNLAFGNADYYAASLINGWQIEYFMKDDYFNNGGDSFMMPFWWGKIWDSKRFQNKLYQRWAEVRRTVLDVEILMSYIDETALELQQAQERNFDTWPVLGQYVWPNYYIGHSYQDEVNYLKTWIQNRIEWMDDHLQFSPALVNDRTAAVGEMNFRLWQNYPNPFNASTSIPLLIDSPTQLQINIYDARGRWVRTLADDYYERGSTEMIWDGRDSGGRDVASGVYSVQAKSPTLRRSIKVVMLR